MIPVGDVGQNPGKTITIILGGAARVSFVVIYLLFVRSLKEYYYIFCISNYILNTLYIYFRYY